MDQMSDAELCSREYSDLYQAYVRACGSLPRGTMRTIVMQTAIDRLVELIDVLKGTGYVRCTRIGCPREHWYREEHHG